MNKPDTRVRVLAQVQGRRDTECDVLKMYEGLENLK